MKRLKGIGVSPGVAIGKAWIWDNAFLKYPEYSIDREAVDSEIDRFNEALKKTEAKIKDLQENFKTEAGKQYADIFSFYLAFLKDALLKGETENM